MLVAQPSSADLAGLTGYALVALVCGLLLVEELGVPLFFAPGDLLLVTAGIAIPTASLNPLVVVAATACSVMAGAVAGRELFDRFGASALLRIATFLHVSARLERLAARLRTGGPAAVFLGRITPGLRVHTTEAAGLARMRRSVFLAGLVPAVAVYEAVFVGLGIWLGPAAWPAIQADTPKPVPLFVLLGAVAVCALTGRWLVHRIRERRGQPSTLKEA
jgi:membrane protein DedA with SNARE-associated domain